MAISGVGSRTANTIQSLVSMRSQLTDLQRQLGTGKKSDTYAGVGIERGVAVGLRARLSAIDAYGDTISNVGVRLSLAQTTLTRISAVTRTVKSATLLSPYKLESGGQTVDQRNARSQLDEILGLLNTQAGDRYLFGGRVVDRPVVESLTRILDGDATHAGFRQVMEERRQADLGATGLGRLVIPAATAAAATVTGTTATLTPDAAGTVSGALDISALTSSGGTLEINGTPITIVAGDNAAAIQAAINLQTGTTGVGAALNGSNQLVLTGVDADTGVDIGAGTSAGILAELGLSVGTANPTNLLTQGAVTAGQTLTVQVGASAMLTVTFGTGVGAVSTLAELNTALGTLAGGTASVNAANGNISITAGNTVDQIAIGGTATAANFGLGAATVSPTGAVSIGEDVAGSPFGFKLAGIGTTITGATTTAPAGSPPAMSVALAAQPTAGQTVKFTFTLPDGSSENLTLTATTTTPPGTNEFTIGATPAATAANLKTALDAGVGTLARTALTAASAIAASHDFFDVDAGQPPMRVTGPSFATATALVAGTSADTISWYTGEMGTDDPRGTAVARADESISVQYGMRANEQALRWSVEHIAVFATMTFSPSDTDADGRYGALKSRLGPALDVPAGQQTVEDIEAELAGAQTTLKSAKERHRQAEATYEGLLDDIEGAPEEEVGAKILALQTRLQASLQTTAMLYKTSLVNFL